MLDTLGCMPQAHDLTFATLSAWGVGTALLAACLSTPIVERRRSRRAGRELARMRLLGSLAREVLLIQQDGLVAEVNDAGARLFGCTVDRLMGSRVGDLFAQESRAAVERRTRCAPGETHPEEVCALTSAGALVQVEISCQRIVHLGRTATAVALRDLTESKRDEARLRQLARHDALTDLPNRNTLGERLDGAINEAGRSSGSVAVLYLDLDRFKPVNDLHGHAAGDALLVEASRRIKSEIRSGDTLARIGGDEFVVVLAGDGSSSQAADVAARIIDTLGSPFDIQGVRVEIGCSVGVSLYPGDGSTATALMKNADTAMYRVKEEGRGRLRFFEREMDAKLQAARDMERDLANAVERGEMLLHYQPIFDASGEVRSFEALLRWNHPVRGMVPPVDFIPAAERTDLITRIGNWAIDAACAEASRWQGGQSVAVNVSPTQFKRVDLREVVAAALSRHGLDASRLVVEVTEGTLIEDGTRAIQTLNGLRGMGVLVSLDDFGTGFSSLGHLASFEFDKLKVEGSIVRKVETSEVARNMVNAIVNLGRNMRVDVVAEGVETPRQLGILQGLGCDGAQGYLMARPLPAGAFGELDAARVRAMFARERPRLTA